jgi:hypothetical protein
LSAFVDGRSQQVGTAVLLEITTTGSGLDGSAIVAATSGDQVRSVVT